jgi:hypothetical protein
LIGYFVAYSKGHLFREGLFQFSLSFSLPWYAIVGAQTGVEVGLPVLGALALAIIGATTGRFMIDITCGIAPKHFVRGEWFVGTAVLTGGVWIILASLGASKPACALVSFAIGFTFRVVALYRGWEEPLAKEPARVYQHSDGRPLLGRKLGENDPRATRPRSPPRASAAPKRRSVVILHSARRLTSVDPLDSKWCSIRNVPFGQSSSRISEAAHERRSRTGMHNIAMRLTVARLGATSAGKRGRVLVRGGCQQAEGTGAGDGVGPGVCVELFVQVAQMSPHRVARDVQLAGDLRPRQVRWQVAQHP